MARLDKKQMDKLKKIYGVDTLWSYSRLSTLANCSWLYKMKYVDRERGKDGNIYSFFGTIAHDIRQDFDAGVLKSHHEMLEEFNKKVALWRENPKYRFNTETEASGYINNLQNYFFTVTTPTNDIENERPIIAVFEDDDNKFVFQGYIDAEYIENDFFVIEDYKTSSIGGFTGKALMEKSEQLIIYAIAISQQGRTIKGEKHRFPIEKIKLRYDMMKYCIISHIQKNGKLKETKAERRLWVSKMSNQIRKDFEAVATDIAKLQDSIPKLEKKMNAKVRTEDEREQLRKDIIAVESEILEMSKYDFDPFEADDMIETSILLNSLENMPEFIQSKYTISDCLIDIELTQEIVDEVKASVIERLKSLEEKVSKDDEKEFEREPIQQFDSFFCTVLCDMSEKCKYYKDYKENREMFMVEEEKSEDEIMKELGLL